MRSWNSHGTEHKPGIKGNNDSAIKNHADKMGHDVHPNYIEILEHAIGKRQKEIIFGIVALCH